MTHECTEEPPSSFSGSNHFFDQLSLIAIFSPTFICDGIIFDCMDRRSFDLMTLLRCLCIACLYQTKIIYMSYTICQYSSIYFPYLIKILIWFYGADVLNAICLKQKLII